jgi:hypothetical protein
MSFGSRFPAVTLAEEIVTPVFHNVCSSMSGREEKILTVNPNLTRHSNRLNACVVEDFEFLMLCTSSTKIHDHASSSTRSIFLRAMLKDMITVENGGIRVRVHTHEAINEFASPTYIKSSHPERLQNVASISFQVGVGPHFHVGPLGDTKASVHDR